jgi:hypothetical protein
VAEARVVELLIDRVQSQLDAQLQGDDALDLKALGVLAANAAAFGVLVTVHDSLPLWWIAALLLLAGAVCVLVVVWPLDLSDGPQWGEWYDSFGGRDRETVSLQMLADLLKAMEDNSSATSGKGSWFRWGFIFTLAGVGAGLFLALVR